MAHALGKWPLFRLTLLAGYKTYCYAHKGRTWYDLYWPAGSASLCPQRDLPVIHTDSWRLKDNSGKPNKIPDRIFIEADGDTVKEAATKVHDELLRRIDEFGLREAARSAGIDVA